MPLDIRVYRKRGEVQATQLTINNAEECVEWVRRNRKRAHVAGGVFVIEREAGMDRRLDMSQSWMLVLDGGQFMGVAPSLFRDLFEEKRSRG